MTRPSKSGTNLLCVDIGKDRKEQFSNALPRNKSITEALKEYMDSVIEESKKAEAPDGLPIFDQNVTHSRQTTISEYDIKLFQQPEERMDNLKHLDKEQQTKLAQDVLYLQQQIRAVRK